MKLGPWRIREIAPDFTVEDVWALPVYGGAGDFPALLGSWPPSTRPATDPPRFACCSGSAARYMSLIAPFRYWVVYPALMRQIERAWKTRVP
jgi:hypothetical protein